MKVGIIGTNGYLGAVAKNVIQESGHAVIDLPKHVLPQAYRDNTHLDLVLDCGFPRHYKKKNTMKIYFRDLDNRLRHNYKQGIPYVYIGSFSSKSQVMSNYGKRKLAAEKRVIENGGTILRLGLVINHFNPGGRFRELLIAANKMPVRPTFPANWCPLIITFEDDFKKGVSSLIHLLNRLPQEIAITSVEMDLCEVLSRYAEPKYELRINDFLTSQLMKIVKFFPVKNLDNLKSIAFKKSR